MNKQEIIYMLQKILYKQEIIEMKKVLKEMVVFFVLQLHEIVLLTKKRLNTLKNSHLNLFLLKFQFFIFHSGFSVSAPAPVNLNSLYPAPGSLKIRK